MVARLDLLYQGKAKKLYATDNPQVLWVDYQDQATAFNGEKQDTIPGKAKLNNQITALFFEWLKENDIPSHFISLLSDTEQLVQKVEIVPLEVVVRNVAAGSLSKRTGLPEGESLPRPIVELYYKNDELGDPLINDEHVDILQLATPAELEAIRDIALRVNGKLMDMLASCQIRLIDFKLEFGRDVNGQILLADEISPDTCRFWDAQTGQRLDKDVYRRDLGDLISVYQVVLSRLNELVK